MSWTDEDGTSHMGEITAIDSDAETVTVNEDVAEGDGRFAKP